MISTVDPETRHMHKSRSVYRDGFKAHVAVEPDTGIITGVDLTPANAGDGPTGVALLAGEEPGLEILADSAYGSGQVRHDLDAAGHTAVIKPWPLARNPKLGADQFHRDDFTIDYQARTVTCPENQTVPISPAAPPTSGPAAAAVRSGPAAPQPSTARPSGSPTTTSTSPPPAPTGRQAPASRTTASTDPWSNAPSPGSSPTTTAGSATAASTATASDCPPELPRSTCDA